MKTKQASCRSWASCSVRYSREDIAGMNYEKDSDGFEAVTIRFTNGYEKTANVTGDSCIAIMADVYKAMI